MKFDPAPFNAAKAPVPLQQHTSFVAALLAIGSQVEVTALPGNGSAAVMHRRVWPFGHLRLVSRGPIWPSTTTDLQKYEALGMLRKTGVQLINNEDIPPAILRAAGFRQIITPTTVAELDLSQPPALRRKAMTAKWRNALRKAEGANLRIVARPYAHQTDRWLLDADRVQQRARGYKAMPPAITQAFALMNDGMAQIVTALKDGDPVAAMIVLRHGRAATYHVGWTSTEGRKYNAHNLCLASAADQLAKQGIARFDLGLLDTETLPGLARFKLGCGAKPRTLGGTWLHLPIFRRRSLV